MNKIFMFMLMSVFVISLVSANGITITNNDLNVSKLFDETKEFKIQVKNEETFNFKNITFEDNDFVRVKEKFNLNSGESKNITIEVFGDEDIKETFNLIGFYYVNTGVSDDEYEINVDYQDGLSKCNSLITEGDRITWINDVQSSIKLINDKTKTEIAQIDENKNYSSVFNSAQTLDYYFTRWGYKFTDTCRVQVLPAQGYVNNPDFDGKLDLNLINKYKETSISLSAPVTSYSTDFYRKQDGFLTITNNGNDTAKNIKLAGSWFSFAKNNFDLEPGYSENIGYSILPNIAKTADTNKTYEKTINVSGNFQTKTKTFSIFIKHAIIGESNMSNATNFIDYICSVRPDLCKSNPQIIYRDLNGSGSFNVTFERQQVKGFFEALFTFIDEQRDQNKFDRENEYNQTEILKEAQKNMNATQYEVRELKEDYKFTYQVLFFLGLLFGTIVIVGLGVFYLLKIRQTNRIKLLNKYY